MRLRVRLRVPTPLRQAPAATPPVQARLAQCGVFPLLPARIQFRPARPPSLHARARAMLRRGRVARTRMWRCVIARRTGTRQTRRSRSAAPLRLLCSAAQPRHRRQKQPPTQQRRRRMAQPLCQLSELRGPVPEPQPTSGGTQRGQPPPPPPPPQRRRRRRRDDLQRPARSG